MKEISQDMITAINKAIVLGVCSELCILEIRDNSYGDLKQRLNRLAAAATSIQRYFQVHPNASPELREVFKTEFLSGRNVLISEILTLLTNMGESGCEAVLTSIQEVIKETSEISSEGSLLTH